LKQNVVVGFCADGGCERQIVSCAEGLETLLLQHV